MSYSQSQNKLFRIDLNQQLSKDSVTLIVNDQVVFKDSVLTYIYQEDSSYQPPMFHFSATTVASTFQFINGNTINTKNGKLKIEFWIKNEKYHFTTTLSKGKYIQLDLNGEWRQQHSFFPYF